MRRGRVQVVTSGRRFGLWPPYPLSRRRGFSSDPQPFPLDREHSLYARARQGLWHGVRALGLKEGEVILAPAYHQGAEIEAFVRAGLRVRYYDTAANLEPVPKTLDDLLTPEVRALHLIHYWGFVQDAARWRAWCDERGLLLIEDGAQAFLSSSAGTPAGASGDLAVFCLYKSFGLPDGAAAFCTTSLPEPHARTRLGLAPLIRRVGSALAQRDSGAARLHAKLSSSASATRVLGEFLEGEYELGDPWDPPSLATRMSMSWVIDSRAASRRRENYTVLLTRLREAVPGPFRVLKEGAVPIAFPIETGAPELLAAALVDRGIDTGVLWPTWHPTLPVAQFPVARRFRERVLALPVHQELSRSDMEWIADSTQRLLER